MADKEGAQIDTLPAQMYGHDGEKPIRIKADANGNINSTGHIKDQSGETINPATEETLLLLRRIVKLLESNATVDLNNRQRVTLDSVPAIISTLGIALPGLTSGAGAPITNAVTAAAPTQSAASTYFQPVWVGPVDQRFQIMDTARMVYDTCMRSKLAFT